MRLSMDNLKMKSKIYYGLAVAMVLVIYCSMYYLRAGEVHANMKVIVNVKDLPDNGLIIVGPADTAFNGLIDASLYSEPKSRADIIRTFSVFIKNTSRQRVVGYRVTWRLTDNRGKTVSRVRTFIAGGALMDHWHELRGSEQYRNQFIIKPNEFKFVSLVPFSGEPSSEYGPTTTFTTGNVQEGLNTADEPRLAAQKRGIDKAIESLSADLQRNARITVALDGAFFEDGTYVGQNSTLFERIQTEYSAKRDLYSKILHMAESKQPDDKISTYLTEIAGAPWGKTDSYEFFQKVFGRGLLGLWQRGRPEAAINQARSGLAREWAPLQRVNPIPKSVGEKGQIIE